MKIDENSCRKNSKSSITDICSIEQKAAFIYPTHKGKSKFAQTIDLFLFCHHTVKYMKN